MMGCIGCGLAAVSERSERTAQGYQRFRCRTCGKQFNERSAGVDCVARIGRRLRYTSSSGRRLNLVSPGSGRRAVSGGEPEAQQFVVILSFLESAEFSATFWPPVRCSDSC
jgi:hypothetical protein